MSSLGFLRRLRNAASRTAGVAKSGTSATDRGFIVFTRRAGAARSLVGNLRAVRERRQRQGTDPDGLVSGRGPTTRTEFESIMWHLRYRLCGL